MLPGSSQASHIALPETCEDHPVKISEEISELLSKQNSRPLTTFQIEKLEKDARKNWDIFYKLNSTKFFKDRHWTLGEFSELVEAYAQNNAEDKETVLIEAGCGVGNFLYPILGEFKTNFYVYACDFSPRAIDFVIAHPEYDAKKMSAFTADLTTPNCFDNKIEKEADFSSLIFVLSAICPSKHEIVIENLGKKLRRGGVLFFRDYGRYDMAQLRFKSGKKISENFYVRRDGTRSYYFTPEEVIDLFTKKSAFSVLNCEYVYRRTVNLKEEVDVERKFVQGKFLRN